MLGDVDNATISSNVEFVVDRIPSRRPDIRVLLLGYDFLPVIVVLGLAPEMQNGRQIDP